ncbi:MAG: TIGR00725 family protein [Desulfobacterales bacterium]
MPAKVIAKVIVGVMGGGHIDARQEEQAYRLGRLIAEQGWVLLNGGRRAGVMEASARGAFEAGGLTVGVLPDDHYRHQSPYIHIPILTGMGSARNYVNVLSSHVVVACPGGAGTVSEVALALKHERPVVLLDFDLRATFPAYTASGQLQWAQTPEAAVKAIHSRLPNIPADE